MNNAVYQRIQSAPLKCKFWIGSLPWNPLQSCKLKLQTQQPISRNMLVNQDHSEKGVSQQCFLNSLVLNEEKNLTTIASPVFHIKA